MNERLTVNESIEELTGDDMRRIGRFEMYNNFETGVLLNCETSEGYALIRLSPSEALELTEAIEHHRAELEGFRGSAMDDLAATQVAIEVSRPASGPLPIPTNLHNGSAGSKAEK